MTGCPVVRWLRRRCHRRLRVSPDHVSSLSRPGTRPGIRPVIHADQLEALALLPWFPAAFRLPAFAFGHPVPAGELSSPYGRPTARPEGRADPDGVSTFRTLKQRPGWVPSISRGRRCSSRPTTIIGLRLSHLSDPSLRSATTTHLKRGSASRDINQEFTRVHPSGLPLAGGSRMEREPSGFPPSSAPRDYSQRTSGQGQAIEHEPETRFTASAEPPTSRVYLIRATSCRTRGRRRLVPPEQSPSFLKKL